MIEIMLLGTKARQSLSFGGFMKKLLLFCLAVTLLTAGVAVCLSACGTKTPMEGLVIEVSEDGSHAIVKEIGGAKNDREITLPSVYQGVPVTVIGDGACANCTNLESITLPESVATIGDGAFWKCTRLAAITLPDKVTTVGRAAFYGCSALTGVTLPEGVTAIGEDAFAGCTSLAGILLPESVTAIGGHAFGGCTRLAGIVLPDGVATVEKDTFADCTSLSSVTIPKSVTQMEGNPFVGCNLTSIEVAADNPVYHSAGNCLIETESKTLVSGGQNSVIPDDGSVTAIGAYAFAGCARLTGIAIPQGVSAVGEHAFENCAGLSSITLPDGGVTAIGDYAFCRCVGLTSVALPDGVATIGKSAFYGCAGLASITIPESVAIIDSFAFGCEALARAEFKNTDGWHRGGQTIDVSNPAMAAEFLKSGSFLYQKNDQTP